MCGRRRRQRRLHTDRWSARPLAKVSAGLLKRGMWSRCSPGSRACRDAPSAPSLSSLSLFLFSYSHLVVTFQSSVLSLVHVLSSLLRSAFLRRCLGGSSCTCGLGRLASSLLSHFTAVLPSLHPRNAHRLSPFRKSLHFRRVSHFKIHF